MICASWPTLFTRNATSLAAVASPDRVLRRTRSRWAPLLSKNVFKRRETRTDQWIGRLSHFRPRARGSRAAPIPLHRRALPRQCPRGNPPRSNTPSP